MFFFLCLSRWQADGEPYESGCPWVWFVFNFYTARRYFVSDLACLYSKWYLIILNRVLAKKKENEHKKIKRIYFTFFSIADRRVDFSLPLPSPAGEGADVRTIVSNVCGWGLILPPPKLGEGWGGGWPVGKKHCANFYPSLNLSSNPITKLNIYHKTTIKTLKKQKNTNHPKTLIESSFWTIS